jgi:hypothetical protein
MVAFLRFMRPLFQLLPASLRLHGCLSRVQAASLRALTGLPLVRASLPPASWRSFSGSGPASFRVARLGLRRIHGPLRRIRPASFRLSRLGLRRIHGPLRRIRAGLLPGSSARPLTDSWAPSPDPGLPPSGQLGSAFAGSMPPFTGSGPASFLAARLGLRRYHCPRRRIRACLLPGSSARPSPDPLPPSPDPLPSSPDPLPPSPDPGRPPYGQLSSAVAGFMAPVTGSGPTSCAWPCTRRSRKARSWSSCA